ncbi:MAG: hypothetical protein WCJ60_04310 [bacterium]
METLHVNKQKIEGGYICTCSRETGNLAEANMHTKYFDNTPNAIKLYEAMRNTNER